MPVPNRCCCRRVSAIGTNKLLHDHLAEKGTFRVLFTCAHPPSLFSCRSGITQTVGIQVARPKPPRGTSRVTISALRWEEKGFLNFFTCGFSFFFFFAFSFAFFWILRLVASEYMTFFIPVSPRRYCHPLLLAPPICSPLIPLQLLNVDCDFVPGCCVTLNVHKISSACGTTKVISVSLVFCVCVFSLSLSLSLSQWHMLQ